MSRPSEIRDRIDQLKLETKEIGRQLNALWDPVARNYQPKSELIRLHDLINENLREYYTLRQELTSLALAEVHKLDKDSQ